MINIEINQTHCIIANKDNKNARTLQFKGADQTGIINRRIAHKWFCDNLWRVDIFYNNDGKSLNRLLVYKITDKGELILTQINVYKKGKLKKITHFNTYGFDKYLFKDDLLIEEQMYLITELINDYGTHYFKKWMHTLKTYDYEDKLIRYYYFDTNSNRIWVTDKKPNKIEKMF